MTKKEMFTTAIALAEAAENNELVEMLSAELEKVTVSELRKAEEKAKKAEENAEVSQVILDILADADKPLSATDIKDELDNGSSVQKVSYLLTQLRKEGKVVQTYDKRKSFYVLATE